MQISGCFWRKKCDLRKLLQLYLILQILNVLPNPIGGPPVGEPGDVVRPVHPQHGVQGVVVVALLVSIWPFVGDPRGPF